MGITGRLLMPIVGLFIAISSFVSLSGDFLIQHNIDKKVLLTGNVILFIISILSIFIQSKGFRTNNPNAFVRTVMAGMMTKMLICVAAVLAYVLMSGNTYNKRGLFIVLFFYLLYLALEVAVLMKINKHKPGNA